MTTDYRALCSQLLDVINSLPRETNYKNESRCVFPIDEDVVSRARLALNQPEPEEPTDEELLMTYQHAVSAKVESIIQSTGAYYWTIDDHTAVTLAGLHAVIARWCP